MVKNTFGDEVRANTPTTQVNEVLMKVSWHNICCLIRAMHSLSITPVSNRPRLAEVNASVDLTWVNGWAKLVGQEFRPPIDAVC